MNEYLKKQEDLKQAYFDAGEEIGIQKIWDYVQLVLTDPDVMSTHVLTKDRIKKVYTKLQELTKYYMTAFSDDVEADFRQEELDRALKEIWGDELEVFKHRYPNIKQQSYKRGKKKWTI